MSLILDALKKIEGEKGEAGEKGVLVLGAVPWGERQARRTSLVVGATLGVLGVFALGGLATWWLLRPTPAPAPGVVAATAQPALPVPAAPAPAAATQAPPSLPANPAPRATFAAPVTAPAPASEPAREPAAPAPAAAPAAPAAPAAAAPPAPSASSDLRLTAISQRDGQPVALLNDRLVRAGDSFDGIRVIRIGESEVEVEVRGQRRVIRF
ncbi:MAG: hypothetical protein U0599_16240 [Vicinamibacteria bacterium]